MQRIFLISSFLIITLIISIGCVQSSNNSDVREMAGQKLDDIELDIKSRENRQERQNLLENNGPRVQTKGTYKGDNWHIDEKNLLWWDGNPYVPFSINQIWIDHDRFRKNQFPQHFKYLNELTDRLTREGKSYFVLFLTHPEIKTLKDLGEPHIKAAFEDEWRKFGPAVAKKGLRAMTFYNEINVLRAPEGLPPRDYQKILNGYAKSMKIIVGDVPVILKVVSDWNIDVALAAIQGDHIDGLGGDFFSDQPDKRLEGQMQRPVQLLKRSKKTKLFWITEFSRMTGEEPHTKWPAFESKEQMKQFMEIFILNGATGFFYFDIHRESKGFAEVTPETAQWFQELKDEMKNRIRFSGKGERTS